MMNTRRNYIAFSLMLMTLLAGCSTQETDYPDASDTGEAALSKPIIAATNLALQSMTKEIVGDFADVILPHVQRTAGGGLDMEEVLALQRAVAVFTNGPGADDAAWLNLISLDASRVFATTSDEFELSDFIQVEDYRTVHSHGDQGEHSHPWLVPHCWLAPRLASAQSQGILNRLIEVFPEQTATFTANHSSLSSALEPVKALAGEVGELIQSKKITVIASDPRLLFFTRSLNLEDDYFLWFDPPEISVAIAEMEKRRTQSDKRLLLLCPQHSGLPLEELSNATNVVTAEISLIEKVEGVGQTKIEEVRNSQEFISMIRANYQSIKTVVEGVE